MAASLAARSALVLHTNERNLLLTWTGDADRIRHTDRGRFETCPRWRADMTRQRLSQLLIGRL